MLEFFDLFYTTTGPWCTKPRLYYCFRIECKCLLIPIM